MRKLILPLLAAAALIFSACDQESNVTGPVSPRTSTFMKYADQLNLTTDQYLQINEVFYLGHDMSVILDPAQVTVLTNILNGAVSAAGGDGRIDPRGFFDMQVLMWYRLVLRANPDLSEEQKEQIKAAIEASNQIRIEIIKNTELTPEEKREALQAEHERLMNEINGGGGYPGILLPDQVDKAKALQEELEKKREEIRNKMLERRIEMQVQAWTRILKLDPQQQEAVKNALRELYTKTEQLREQYKGDPEGFRQAMLQLQNEFDSRMREILTEEQIIIWDRMHGKITPGGGGRGGIGPGR
ncbi:MAG: hypothetical protein QHI48_10970 [Bacteroidota bacterium]|nr:hypothetical protein [Bacteroidota bacterium]